MIGKVTFSVLLLLLSSFVFAEADLKPLVGFTGTDNQIFPAYILSVAGNAPETSTLDEQEENSQQYVSESPDTQVGAAIASETDASVVLDIVGSKFIRSSKWSGNIKGGTAYQIFPLIDWDYDQLNRLVQPEPVTITFSLKVDGVDLVSKKIVARFRSVNDVPYGFYAGDKFVSMAHVFSAFVNENHPWIDGLLKEALNTDLVKKFDGYQSKNSQVVSQQVFAIWNILQKRGIRYSSITTSSGESEKIFSQHVRFLDESISYTQANCVDGTILFASILKKIGIEPILVKIPGHMFLGFYIDEGMRQPVFLETTMLGLANINSLDRDGSLLGSIALSMGGNTQNSASANIYMKALNSANDNARKNWSHFKSGEPGYVFLAIKDARSLGINPINFAATSTLP